jgi:osmoprotectant transport system ATP-binding protein
MLWHRVGELCVRDSEGRAVGLLPISALLHGATA